MLRSTAVALAFCAIALGAAPASSKEEPFGQETVEVRPWRNPPKPGTQPQHSHAHDHKHSHGTHGHDHDDHQHKPDTHGHNHGIETEHLFGFTMGSDIDEPGVKHFIAAFDGRFTKRTGSYVALSQRFEYAFTPWRNFHVGLGASFAAHQISGVDGLDDRRPMAFQGLAVEFRQRLLDRMKAPFGLTLTAEPHWGRVDETSGAPVDAFGVGLTLAADKELIKDRLFAAANLIYEPEWSRLKATGESDRESTLGVSFAAMTTLAPSILAGGELRYLRRYEGAALNSFAGEALYLGPALFINLNHTISLITAYSMQVSGRAIGATGGLDLDHFERHRAKFKAVIHF